MEENTNQNTLLSKTFFWMFLGLLGTGIIAWYTYASNLYVDLLFSNGFAVVCILELVVVLLFSLFFKKLPPTVVGILYFVYSMINGVTLSTIFALYELNSIVMLFIISALIFAVLAYYGRNTNNDLSSWGTILFAGLIAGIILSIINLFLGNSMLDILIDWAMLVVFFGFTAYDMNKIKAFELESDLDQNKLHIYCAMQLYLDFINLFIRILSIFGKRRN